MLFALFQLVGGVILSFGWIPQIIQIIRTRSVADLNPKTFWSLLIGIGLMEVYAVSLAVEGVGYAFLITNSMSLVLIVVILLLIFRYRHTVQSGAGK
ncbi:hypothetical protein JCM10914A_29300 [Paenibacillus sp. JCM 10914]|uniref:PQ-loop domain-containing transporter n=1 Tax=Paenibacillus sp. JCM 10914 TaxID=1236974 RepID=UPI0003CC7CCD|nr:PQ-loop domain-containing transporter [Paenibacillus sp. JCM 10914]GAE09427.1 hypothetical protein JCM10914_5787 [Paenibacillus sp. JCM 10914]